MIPKVKTKKVKLEEYSKTPFFNEVKKLSKKLSKARIVHMNSAKEGGGVAEILKSLVPLMNSAGLKAEWILIPEDKKFFEQTKSLHNSLQGKKTNFSKKEYLKHLEKTAKKMKGLNADFWVLHDPQPAGLVDFFKFNSPVISRIHIDSSDPDPVAWDFIKDFVSRSDRIIFSAEEFAGKGFPPEKTRFFAPAIDPFSLKNKKISLEYAKKIIKKFKINVSRPLTIQVSRFDPAKDPLGVIKAYKIAKKEVKGLQLALLGLIMAEDDPEARIMLNEIEKEREGDKDIFVFSNPAVLNGISNDIFVNAFQTGSDIVLQKSLKEGFGLTVAEAMWKEKAVIGGNAGGIRLQIKNGENGFLADSPEEAAFLIKKLIQNAELKERIGRKAKKSVSNRFLILRLLRDYLKMFSEI
ncbi:MAG: hypothetical protein A2365_02275 [Candidatus Nealsonbacteria bacterium RIFOXYB1_FULL_40_15]|uniref:Uncharacterized protein n=2 Tax=Candidatus Nealsoniibacteriota TaxID=1817911 RepID=A0A1G2EUB3_9BACT|nr:MAG: hypothetical protein A2365_02275 [Candidatus Nealsonbacteria bacterium RIFOXYB1_FULL_40_15]OGZ28481.1 MAG: hypothetical protein A2562_03360 [Candidatus Nealsonbacteria bacterium RIFOXYD1_FULL_39_11]OGZ29092.1 MAG: hypothetical protein A2427_02125 [Candidatus Nealsonbacteria bacterium RIFOXYC1_FULL_40_7]